MLKRLLPLFLLPLAIHLRAQETPKPPAQPDYSKEAFVVEERTVDVSFTNEGMETRRTFARIRIQSDAGVQQFAVTTFSYAAASEALDIDFVRVHKPDGSVVNTPLDNVQDLPSATTQQAPLYSDQHEKHVAVKGLSAGDVLEYQRRLHTTKPLIPGQFWFASDAWENGFILKETLRIAVPRNRAVKWHSVSSQPVITESGNQRIFFWTAIYSDVPSQESQTTRAEKQVAQMRSGKLPPPDVQLSSFASWEEIGALYNHLQQGRATPTPELRAKAAEITKGLSSDRAKAEALYAFVSSNVHYVGIDLGIGRFQPHSAAEVLANQYGDCKDKQTLLTALLTAVGIPSYPALVGVLHSLDPAVPSLAQFDHVINAVSLDGKIVWLDTTPEVASFEYLITSLRGKQALVVYDAKPSAWLTTPANPPTQPEQTFSISAKLNDSGTLEGKVEQTFHGTDEEVLLRMVLRRTPMGKWKDLIQSGSRMQGFGGDISDPVVSQPEKLTTPLHLGYTYTRENYPGWTDRKITAPLPNLYFTPLPKEEEKTTEPISPASLGTIRSESRLSLPKGYRPKLAPSLDLDEPFASFHRSEIWKDSVLITQQTLIWKTNEIPAAQLAAYKKFVEAVQEGTLLKIALSSGTTSPLAYQTDIWSLPNSTISAASRAYDETREKVKRNDLPGAISLLQTALEADPKWVRAWLWLGELYKVRSQHTDELDAYRKALAADPAQVVTYKALGLALNAQKKYDEALPIWKRLTQLAPEDPAGLLGLGLCYSLQERFKEAESAFESATSLDPENGQLWMVLGRAHLQGGDEDRALAAYAKAIAIDPRPVFLNNAAFEIADLGKNYQTALQYAQKAIQDEESVSQKLDLAKLKTEDLTVTRSLASYWDTIGWVYYRLDRLPEAESYLNAAWLLSESWTIGDHLGELYAHAHKKALAIRQEQAALTCVPSRIAASSPEVQKLRERLEHLSPGASKLNSRETSYLTGELSHMRSTSIPLRLPVQASADFFVTFTPNPQTASFSVADVKFISGSDRLQTTAPPAIKAAQFHIPIPPDTHARLLRRGIVVCNTLSGCSFTLLNPDDVHSLN